MFQSRKSCDNKQQSRRAVASCWGCRREGKPGGEHRQLEGSWAWWHKGRDWSCGSKWNLAEFSLTFFISFLQLTSFPKPLCVVVLIITNAALVGSGWRTTLGLCPNPGSASFEVCLLLFLKGTWVEEMGQSNLRQTSWSRHRHSAEVTTLLLANSGQ